MAATLDYESNIGLVHLIARRTFGWAQALDLPLDYEDVFQEASAAYVNASRNFDPSKGLQFSTYFTSAAFNEIKKSIGRLTGLKHLREEERDALRKFKEENKRRAAVGLPQLDEPYMGIQTMRLGDMKAMDEDTEWIDTIASDDLTPEDQAEQRSAWAELERGLSPVAKLMVGLLVERPEPMMRELRRQTAHAQYLTDIGVRKRLVEPDLNFKWIGNFVCKFFGVREEDVMLAQGEIRRAIDKL